MSKFKSIEIADIVSLHPKVEMHKFFGLFEHVQYSPTRSSISSYRNFYTAQEAEMLLNIAEGTETRQLLDEANEICTTEGGKYRMDLCISKDHRFVAFQVFEQQDNTFRPYSKLCFLEGEEAQAFENLLA